MEKQGQRSFSLVEVLIFTSILSVFFVVAASMTVASIRNMQINEHKILGTRYAEELLEWLRSKKDEDWKALFNKETDSPTSYCFNSLPSDFGSWTTGNCESSYTLRGIYRRWASLKKLPDETQMQIAITVEWRELGNTYSVPINTIVSVWE